MLSGYPVPENIDSRDPSADLQIATWIEYLKLKCNGSVLGRDVDPSGVIGGKVVISRGWSTAPRPGLTGAATS